MTTNFSRKAVVGAAPEPATSGYASAALVFSIVGAVLLGVFCAIAALLQPETLPQGRREAIAALVISATWVVVAVAALHGSSM
ncbi:hypothetical protein [Mycobacterium sp. TY814]|uniref:hypothetical protein n=1 Tax=unclassified Mycobacterium TaxID=2642494 RepID=UPI0027409816|nr:hypothetical protein [Mycobacterium sp. TY814]MDP7725783.1 hypothetical protein [Mycobacterium sp. TY814]